MPLLNHHHFQAVFNKNACSSVRFTLLAPCWTTRHPNRINHNLKQSSFRYKSSVAPPSIPGVKCENNHVTWPKKQFVELLSEEVKRISLLSAGDAKGKRHKNLQHDFMHLAAGMERLVSFQTWDEVDAIGSKFKAIDPDRVKLEIDESENKNTDVDEETDLKKETDFLRHISTFLKQAGYSEISQNDVENLFLTYHRYENVELKVEIEEFDFLKVWVFGTSGSNQDKYVSFKKRTEKQWKKISSRNSYQKLTSLCHRRVVIAAKSKKSSNMIFKCFKDVPVGHFEALIPQAKIHIPWKQKWFWNIFLLSSGVTFFFNFGLWLQSEHKFGFMLVSAVVLSFILYRTNVIYRNVRNRYNIQWKQMLYYKSTSNNSALAFEILNRARGQNFKKTILAYVAALQAAHRNKGKGVSNKEIIGQCYAWFKKMEQNYPERGVGSIDMSVGISNLLNIGILSYNDKKLYEVTDVSTSLKKVKDELICACTEICDTS
ncbi:transmembrane protein 143-like isoform X1 [Styela clava]